MSADDRPMTLTDAPDEEFTGFDCGVAVAVILAGEKLLLLVGDTNKNEQLTILSVSS